MNIVGLIPARGGSKGIPGKNFVTCAGKPLLAYTAEAALATECLDRVILTTDDEVIANAGRELGLEVPFLRPAEFATDNAGSLGVIEHALGWLEARGERVDAIVLLQPTSPLRTSKHISEAVALFQCQKPDALVSVVEVPHRFHPGALLRIDVGILKSLNHDTVQLIRRRQEYQTLYARNGPAILIITPDQIRRGEFYSGRTIPYIMSALYSVDIDTAQDLFFAECMLRALV
jgi:CMP-N-acetylneuraminic acid synthetase